MKHRSNDRYPATHCECESSLLRLPFPWCPAWLAAGGRGNPTRGAQQESSAEGEEAAPQPAVPFSSLTAPVGTAATPGGQMCQASGLPVPPPTRRGLQALRITQILQGTPCHRQGGVVGTEVCTWAGVQSPQQGPSTQGFAELSRSDPVACYPSQASHLPF